ncbi:hypothetical protein JW707_01730 [Candidatus Woesearchaeota archaeon]|nr:hypothetical protein [Candidatus Woesearchaeota archaeon]
MKQTPQNMDLVSMIRKQCISGRITVVAAVDMIEEAIGGISRVVFKDGLQFKIHNTTEVYDLFDRTGLSKRETERLYGLAVVAYDRARHHQPRNPRGPGEVHISHGVSTKDYKSGIYELLQKYVAVA